MNTETEGFENVRNSCEVDKLFETFAEKVTDCPR